MTEQEWNASVSPQAMLRHMTETVLHETGGVLPVTVRRRSPLVSDRKLRLFACACCRQVWHLLTDDTPCSACKGRGSVPYSGRIVAVEYGRTGLTEMKERCPSCGGSGRINRSRNAVEVAERFADGEATERQMTGAGGACNKALYPYLSPSTRTAKDAAETAAWAVAHIRGHVGVEPIAGAVKHTRIAGVSAVIQAALLRDIAGNPWRPLAIPKTMPGLACSGWAEILTPTVVAVARTIYAERAFEQLPILADACEEAGCPETVECPLCRGHGHFNKGNEERNTCREEQEEFGTGHIGCDGTGRVPHPVLTHLRGPGPHVRGCWVVDLLLGKE